MTGTAQNGYIMDTVMSALIIEDSSLHTLGQIYFINRARILAWLVYMPCTTFMCSRHFVSHKGADNFGTVINVNYANQ